MINIREGRINCEVRFHASWVHMFCQSICQDLVTGLALISSDWLAGAPSCLGHLLCRIETWMNTIHLAQVLASVYHVVTSYVSRAQTARIPSSHALTLLITTQRTHPLLVCLLRTYYILQHGEMIHQTVLFRLQLLLGMHQLSFFASYVWAQCKKYSSLFPYAMIFEFMDKYNIWLYLLSLFMSTVVAWSKVVVTWMELLLMVSWV